MAKQLEEIRASDAGDAGSESQIGDPGAVDFVLKLARALHQYGSAAHRLEDVVDHVAQKLGLQAQVFSQPTSIFTSFGPQSSQRTFMLRVNPGEVNLGKLSDVDDVVRDVLHGGLSPREGSERLDRVTITELRYGTAANVLSFGVISAASALLLGGGIEELCIASVIGLITGLLSLIAHRSKRFGRVFTAVAALVAAMLASAATQLVGAYSVPTATLAGIIALLPGFTLTVALAELSTQHLASGTARMSGAFIVFLELIFGVALGTAIVMAMLGTKRLPVERADTLPTWVQLVPLVVMPLALTVRLRAHARDAIWILDYGGTRDCRQSAGFIPSGTSDRDIPWGIDSRNCKQCLRSHVQQALGHDVGTRSPAACARKRWLSQLHFTSRQRGSDWCRDRIQNDSDCYCPCGRHFHGKRHHTTKKALGM